MEKNKTAVEWLIEEQRKALTEYSVGNLSFAGYVNLMADKEKKAKEMEKNQMKKTWQDGFSFQSPYKNFEQYYNETYGKSTNRS